MEDATVLSLLNKLSASGRRFWKLSDNHAPESQQNVEPEDTESGTAFDDGTDPPSDKTLNGWVARWLPMSTKLSMPRIGTDVFRQ